MREQIPELTRKVLKELIPDKLRSKLDAEAARLKEGILEKIHYAREIRLAYEPVGCTLSRLESDEMAKQVFEYQLQNENLLNGVTGMKIQNNRNYEMVMSMIRRKINLKLLEENERDMVRRVRNRYFLESGTNSAFEPRNERRRNRRAETGFYWPEQFLIAGLYTDRRDLGRSMIIGYIASEIGKDTQLLRACAARFQLVPAMEMLEIFDSIGFSTPSHIPDLFPAARKIKRHFIIHVGGTNTGKTHDSMEMMAHASSGVYLSPLRMLAYEGREVVRSYGVPCSFATGEEKELDPNAKHISETIGMLDYNRPYDCAVIDECQLISGEDGSLYTNAILGVNAKTVCVCCAYSGLEITKRLIELCGDTWEVIEHHRTSKLVFEDEPYDGPRKNDAYIVFSRLGAHQMAEWLEEQGMTPSIVYGKLPYEVKMEEARKFENGQTDCLVATDAIAIGQNYNIERIVFRDVTKFINRREIRLDTQTVKQVAGRAGRYGRFPIGYVNTWRKGDREEIRMKLEEEDVPSKTAPLELPAFLVEKDLPLSLIYRAWTGSEAGEPFVKADTATELFICRLIEAEFPSIGKDNEYNLASLPLDIRDKDQLELLRSLFAAMLLPTSDEEWKALLPSPGAIKKMVRWRPHLRDCEKLCRDLDLASSFFYKIRRDDLAEYVIHLKPPVTRRIAQIMAEEIPDYAPGEKRAKEEDTAQEGKASKKENTVQESKASKKENTAKESKSVKEESTAQESKSAKEESAAQESKAAKEESAAKGNEAAKEESTTLPAKLSAEQERIAEIQQNQPATESENLSESVDRSGVDVQSRSDQHSETEISSESNKSSSTEPQSELNKSSSTEPQSGLDQSSSIEPQPEPNKSSSIEPQSESDHRPEAEMSPDSEKHQKTKKRPELEEDTTKWPVAYIYITTSGQIERNTGRFPSGDWQKLYSMKLQQSFGNEASYIDYYCYKKKEMIPDYCRTDTYVRYTVKLDPQFIISDEGNYYLAERFLVVKSDFKEPSYYAKPKNYHNKGRRRSRRRY